MRHLQAALVVCVLCERGLGILSQDLLDFESDPLHTGWGDAYKWWMQITEPALDHWSVHTTPQQNQRFSHKFASKSASASSVNPPLWVRQLKSIREPFSAQIRTLCSCWYGFYEVLSGDVQLQTSRFDFSTRILFSGSAAVAIVWSNCGVVEYIGGTIPLILRNSWKTSCGQRGQCHGRCGNSQICEESRHSHISQSFWVCDSRMHSQNSRKINDAR